MCEKHSGLLIDGDRKDEWNTTAQNIRKKRAL